MPSLVLNAGARMTQIMCVAFADQFSVKWLFFFSKYGGPLSLDLA